MDAAAKPLIKKKGRVHGVFLSLFIGLIDAKRGALVQSRTLSCMDAAAKPLIKKKGRVHGVFLPFS